MNFTRRQMTAGKEARFRPMNNDFPKWPRINLPRPMFQPLFAESSAPSPRVSNDRYARNVSFEERLTDGDREFLQAVGIAL